MRMTQKDYAERVANREMVLSLVCPNCFNYLELHPTLNDKALEAGVGLKFFKCNTCHTTHGLSR